MLPLFYQKIGFFYFLVSLLLLFVVLLGILNIWVFLRRKFNIYKNENIFFDLAVSLIVIPWVIFPFHFLSSLLGFYRPFLVGIQVIFIFFGLHAIFHKIHKKILTDLGKISLLPLLCIITVILFIYWPFVMPFAENLNGHHHILMNIVQQSWAKGYYPTIPPEFVIYDNGIYVWPANLALFLSIFSFPYLIAIGQHILFLLPGVLALLTWQLLRQLSVKIKVSPSVGDLSFLMVAFSYYATSDFTAIHFDIFSPLISVFFLLTLVDVFLNKESSKIIFLILAISFTLLLRKQLFLLFFSITVITFTMELLYCWIKKIPCTYKKFNYLIAAIFLIPSIFWCSFVYSKYGSPFFPHDVRITRKLFKLKEPPAIEPHLIKEYHEPLEMQIRHDTKASINAAKNPLRRFLITLRTFKNYSDVNFYIENFIPFHLSKGKVVFVKNLFCGLSNSLFLIIGFIGFIFLLILRKISNGKLLLIIPSIVAGFLITGITFFLTYPKYPHYLGYLITIFSSCFYFYIFGSVLRKRWVIYVFGLMIFISGMLYWGYNLWGHAYKDKTFENIRYLRPHYKTPLDRLVRVINDRRAIKEVEELTTAVEFLKNNGGYILYMEHEPGLAIPSLLNIECFANSYFVESYNSKELATADTDEELRQALSERDIKFVYRPRRWHNLREYTILFDLIKQHNGRYEYIIPINELFGSNSKI